MSVENIREPACWYVLHTKSNQEARAASNLRAWNVEIFSPHIKTFRRNQYTGKPTNVIKPLFSRYIFARFEAESMLHKIRNTRGICGVVSFGGGPTPVNDEIINLIQLRMTQDSFVRLDEEYSSGEELMIKDGPFKGMAGIFNHLTKSADRVMMLLSAVNYQVQIVVERELIRKVKAASGH